MQNTRYNAFVIVIPVFSESEVGIGNNIWGISIDIYWVHQLGKNKLQSVS